MVLRTSAMRALVLTLVAAFALGSVGTGSVLAQSEGHKDKKSFVRRHPNATSAAAGYAAYKLSKSTGKKRQQSGRKRNFMQKHPVLTGVGAAAVTHHHLKKKPKPTP